MEFGIKNDVIQNNDTNDISIFFILELAMVSPGQQKD